MWKHLEDHIFPHARNGYKPHALSHRSLSLYAGLLITVKFVTIFSLNFLPESQAQSSALTQRNILELTNLSRQTYGVGALKENSMLDQAAQAKAEDMLAQSYFSHTAPDGKTPWNFIRNAGYNYIIAGENLAVNFYSAEGVSQAWMNSAEHKSNILNKDFEDIGIGIAQGSFKGSNAVFVVQEFGTSIDQPILTQNSFTKVAPSTPTSLALPAASQSKTLRKPLIYDPGYVLTNKDTATISGEAPGASSVYVIVNNQPQVELSVTNMGEFRGDVQLTEGDNTISAVSFDHAAEASVVSDPVVLKLDDQSPTVVSSVVPGYDGQNLVYKIQVQSAGDPVKIVASVGSDGVMLQPTDDPNIWEGQIAGGDLQAPLNITAYDLAGNTSLSRAAVFSSSVAENYGFTSPHQADVSIYAKGMSNVNNFYIYFALAMVVLLAIAIAFKRNVQYVGLIANASGMIMLAMLLWVI